jgi:hypothetical protein
MQEKRKKGIKNEKKTNSLIKGKIMKLNKGRKK